MFFTSNTYNRLKDTGKKKQTTTYARVKLVYVL